jgi:ATP-dependent exoDNAse (exonuclease V) beta subunit
LGFSESILELWPVREAFLFFCLLVDPDAPTWRAWLGYRTPSATQDHNAPKRNADAYLSFFAGNSEVITHKAVLALAREKRSLSRGRGGSFLWDRACRYKDLYHQQKWKALEPEKLIAAIFNPGLWTKQGDKDVETATLDFELLKVNALQLLEGCKHKGRRARPKEKLRQIAKLLRYSIATREPLTDCPESMVKLTTLWGAKGLTADYVYVVGLCREAIPAKRSQEYPGTDRDYIDEQRRLFYVTITRSKQGLVLSRPLKIKPNEAKHLNLHAGTPNFYHCTLQKCPFLENIKDELPGALDGESLLHKIKARRSKTSDCLSRKTILRTER